MTQNEVTRRAHEDLRWALKNKELQEKYEGERVALFQRKVVAHGCDEGALLKEVDELGLSREEIVIVSVLPAEFEVSPDMNPL